MRRYYLIQPTEAASFQVGKTAQGEQVVLGMPGPFLAAVFFNSSGDFLRAETRPSPLQTYYNSRWVSESQNDELWQLFESWKQTIGFISDAIVITHFTLPAIEVGVYDLPKFLREFCDCPSTEEYEEDREASYEEVRRWRSLGMFVLDWVNEYWINKNGNICDN